ncbi:MAG: argininosuccinate lyase [Planctomycetota bacterium JB042]
MTDSPAPIWDRGDPIDAEMMRFTVGDDWRMDRRLVRHDLIGSIAHCAGLRKAGLIDEAAHDAIRGGLEALLAEHEAGRFDVEEGDEDVHSAVERRLIESIGEAGKRLHTARSRNEQVALDLRLWLRDAIAATDRAALALASALDGVASRRGALPLPGYTHLRRAMPSSVADWAGAHARAFEADARDVRAARERIRLCPLGSGAGYGVPVPLDRAFVAERLGFDGPEEPVTAVQHGRGRAELAYVTALEGVALDLGKLAADLWLFTTSEFGFLRLPPAMTTGSSLMPQKRNPDVVELVRAQARQVVADRAALLDVVRDLPSGYHRDFQLVKEPLFRAHDRVAGMLSLVARLVDGLEFDEEALEAAAADPALEATRRVLEKVKEGQAFRDAYVDESRGNGA